MAQKRKLDNYYDDYDCDTESLSSQSISSSEDDSRRIRRHVFEPQERKSPVRLIKTTNEHGSKTRRHETTPQRLKGDVKDVSIELDNEFRRSVLTYACETWSMFRTYENMISIYTEGRFQDSFLEEFRKMEYGQEDQI
ncbi:hypothetical protein TNCV_4906081 [Trichonephila clavipes]|uniref:Uncharacterized protein n=1 Tax=Trichonephila clavipes TaxID=2585209 RepID=A0A8X6RRZ1_TRICX|nr:hypothetical protein TNCV_4906081 [Trichonephila clavipes]